MRAARSPEHGAVLRRCRTGLGLLACAWAALMSLGWTPCRAATPPTQPARTEDPMWASHIEPILSRNCFKCHGGVKQKGGLDLRVMQSILQGGDDGSVVIPGQPAQSPLYQRILPGAEDHMPPEEGKQLAPQEISLIQHWIATLPTARPGHPTTRKWDYQAPSLLEVARSARYQPPAGMQASAVVDHLIGQKWKQQHVREAAACDDRTFIRRVYLDLAGRIPTESEVEAFVARTEGSRRAQLVDQLLESEDYSRHMAEMLDVVLMERKGPGEENQRKAQGWIDFLQRSVAENRPWNQVVSDLIVARPPSPQVKGAVRFLYERQNNPQQMAEAIAPIVFGVSIGCAQCHNHPLAPEIQQKHYWGLVAAFNRTTNADTPSGPALSESAIGGFVSFTNLKKESQPALITLLSGQTIAEKRPADGAREVDAPSNYLVPPSKDPKHPSVAAIPKFSRRAALAEAVTKNNPLLARAMVNRVWGMLMGRGLVDPVDQMDSRHPPSHPELLSWLSEDFASHGYDLKRLIRIITQSRAYQLSSQPDGTPPLPELFAHGLEKPLPAEVLWRSLLTATGPQPAGKDAEARAQELRHKLIATFPAVFPSEYNATLQQAMFLTNNPLVEGLLAPRDQNLTARLLKLQTSRQRVAGAFAAILGRAPAEDESNAATAYLDARADRPEAAVRQLCWALLSSAEFLMNH